uniref:DUF5675 domain-containing protein n=1 Tax=viral metagenome TaxID=1070528 RepID=A0A6H1ZZH4_9ZZZZ
MNFVILNRYKTSKFGTFGRVYVLTSNIFRCFSLEPPWRGNQSNISCIPKGEYQVEFSYSPHFGHVYRVLNVPNRFNILIHSGNYGGDRSLGLISDTYGCILLGKRVGYLCKQKVILISKFTVSDFISILNREPFKLIINEVYK